MNVGNFIFNIARNLMDLGSKLYDMFTYEVSISWVSKIMSFFGSSTALPETVSLSFLIGGASAVVLLGIIIYNVFKL